jgi:hypothetical protein
VSHFTETRPLFELFPGLSERVRFADLAELPTPVHSLTPVMEALQLNGVEAYEKRDDLTSPRYGGNKVRTLEVLLGRALAAGVTRVYATGAYGSNHAAANALHAPRVGLEAGAVLYPQPTSPAAIENLALILSRRGPTVDLPHWSALPWGMWHTARRCRKRGVRAHVMVPGGATPQGALGYVSAALELAAQVQRGELPPPQSIIVATGSNCTTAGLLVGLAIATRMGLGFSPTALTHAHWRQGDAVACDQLVSYPRFGRPHGRVASSTQRRGRVCLGQGEPRGALRARHAVHRLGLRACDRGGVRGGRAVAQARRTSTRDNLQRKVCGFLFGSLVSLRRRPARTFALLGDEIERCAVACFFGRRCLGTASHAEFHRPGAP